MTCRICGSEAVYPAARLCSRCQLDEARASRWGRDPLDRLMSKVAMNDEGCWVWSTEPGALAHLIDDDHHQADPPADPEPPQEPPMPDIPCRIPGCTQTATRNVGARGVYGTLCDEHYQQQRSRQARTAGPKPVAVRAPREAPPGGTTTLTSLAQQADQALADLSHARQRYQQSLDALRAALDREAV